MATRYILMLYHDARLPTCSSHHDTDDDRGDVQFARKDEFEMIVRDEAGMIACVGVCVCV